MGRRAALLGLLVAVLLAAFPYSAPPLYALSFLTVMFMYIALAESWTILGGYAGYVSFGHVAFFGVGAYTTALLLLHLGLSPLITFPVGGLTAAAFAALVGYPVVRLQGPFFSIVTLLIALLVGLVVKNTPALGGTTGLWLPFPDMPIELNRTIFYWLMLLVAAVTIGAAAWVENSKLGLGLMAIRQNEAVAEAAGINTVRLKLIALILSAGLTGMVGGIYGYLRSYVSPEIVFDLNIAVTLFLMALFGGCRRWPGPVLGAVILSVLGEFLTLNIGEEIARIAYGLCLVLVVFFPDGLIGLVDKVRISRKPAYKGGHAAER